MCSETPGFPPSLQLPGTSYASLRPARGGPYPQLAKGLRRGVSSSVRSWLTADFRVCLRDRRVNELIFTVAPRLLHHQTRFSRRNTKANAPGMPIRAIEPSRYQPSAPRRALAGPGRDLGASHRFPLESGPEPLNRASLGGGWSKIRVSDPESSDFPTRALPFGPPPPGPR